MFKSRARVFAWTFVFMIAAAGFGFGIGVLQWYLDGRRVTFDRAAYPRETRPSRPARSTVNPSGPAVTAADQASPEDHADEPKSRPPDSIDLIVAIQQGDLATVTALLSDGVDPNAVPGGTRLPELGGGEWLPPLFEAVLADDEAIVAALLGAGAEMDVTHRLGEFSFHTALSFAGLHGRQTAAIALIDRGADADGPVCIELHVCGNALTAAAGGGNEAVVQALAARATSEDLDEFLSLGNLEAVVDERRGQSRYGTDSYDLLDHAQHNLVGPLAAAARFGHAEVFSTLLELGADVEGPDYLYSPSPIQYAERNGHSAIVALIEAEHEKAARFITVVQSGDTDRVRELIAQGASVNNGDAGGLTPLIAALDNADVPMVRLLLAAGANPDKGLSRTTEFWADPKPLHVAIKIAIRDGDPEAMQILLEAGADPNAIQRSNGEVDVNIPPMGLAIGSGSRNTQVVGDLTRWGADTNGSYCNGNDCMGIAYLDLAAAVGNVELVRAFIEAGNVVDPAPDSFALRPSDGFMGMSPLMEAARFGHANVVAVLLDEYGVNAAVRNGDGCTALDIAIIYNHNGAAEILRNAGVAADREGCRLYSLYPDAPNPVTTSPRAGKVR